MITFTVFCQIVAGKITSFQEESRSSKIELDWKISTGTFYTGVMLIMQIWQKGLLCSLQFTHRYTDDNILFFFLDGGYVTTLLL